MNEQIRITAAGQELSLPEDFSLDYEDINPLFNDNVESGSYPVKIPLDGNRFLFRNLEDINSDLRAMELEHVDMQIYLAGIPYRSGELVVNDAQEITDSFDFSINSYIRSMSDLVGDLECWDIPIKDQIQIGECIGDIKPEVEGDLEYYIRCRRVSSPTEISRGLPGYYEDPFYEETALDGSQMWAGYRWNGTEQVLEHYIMNNHQINDWSVYCNDKHFVSQETPKDTPVIGFSVPFKSYIEPTTGVQENFINTSLPYPIAKYCNARISYSNYTLDDTGKTSNDIDSSTPYRVLEATRPGSGICFYVLYFFDCLFSYLGLNYSNENLTKVEDMNRLAFFTTHCKYDTVRKYPDNPDIYDLNNLTQINRWLTSHRLLGCQTSQFDNLPNEVSTEVEQADVSLYDFVSGETLNFHAKKDDIISIPYSLYTERWSGGMPISEYWIDTHIRYAISSIYIQNKSDSRQANFQANILNMYANSKNFPKTSVSNILDSMWASFGVKFVYDYEQRTVTPHYIRDVLRDTSKPHKLNGKILSIEKVTEKITGFRMRYAGESDPSEQSKNVRDGVRDYDTAFNYDIIANKLAFPFSQIIYSKSYQEIALGTKSANNINCYIDMATGNAYRWKADKDAASVAELNLSLFEVAGFKGVSKGDCSKRNEDYIVNVTSNFDPIIFSDVNARNEMAGGSTEQILSAFADVNMLNPEEHFKIEFPISLGLLNIPLTATVYETESYDPSNGEDGESPLQSYDWGNSIALMRGGGEDAGMQYYDYNFDGCGNSRWRMVSGTYHMTSDTRDNWGREYDYNGDDSGIGEGERFSLKITAYKHDEEGNPLTDSRIDYINANGKDNHDTSGNILCQDDIVEQGGDITKIRTRGLYDTFMSDYAYFLLNRKKFSVKMLCEVAELVDIPNHWGDRYQIGDLVGWINKIKSHITMQSGLEEVVFEMYCL